MKLPVYLFVLTEQHRAEALALPAPDPAFQIHVHVFGKGDFTRDRAVASVHQLFRKAVPAVWITVSADLNEYRQLFGLPFEMCKRWIHRARVQDIHVADLLHCFVQGALVPHPGDDNAPLISCFTPTFKSGERLMRPIRSLLAQTYTNWELIMVDDSPDGDDATWTRIQGLSHLDSRLKAFRFTHHNGYIGAMKRAAAGVCRGTWLMELDHDDELVPDCLQWIVSASRDHPLVGFMYSDFIETHEGTLEPFHYGDTVGYGFGSYWKQRWNGTWQSRYVTQGMNSLTAANIIGVCNHFRAWRRDVYHRLGGHNPHLPVADDYELLLRTFGATPWLHVCELAYIQYRNKGGNNFTFLRNALIQDLVRVVHDQHRESNKMKFLEAKSPYTEDFTVVNEFECDTFRFPRLEVLWKPRQHHTISIIMPTYNRPVLLAQAIASVQAQTYTDWELYIVGDHCPTLEKVMAAYTDPRIRWWNLAKNHGSGGAVPRNYAGRTVATEFVAYLDDDNTWEPIHLKTLWDKIHSDEESGRIPYSFVWSSFQINGRPIVCKQFRRGRIDTSCVLFRASLIRKYGFWHDRIRDGYPHDYMLFKRWVDGGEPWAVTKLPTVHYNCDLNEQTYEQLYNMYDDQT